MYTSFTFSRSLKVEPIIGVEVRVVWNKFVFFNDGKGGTYAAYTIGSNNKGPGGYFGDQMTNKRGQFLFSLWDGDRKEKSKKSTYGKQKIKKSSRLAWPLNIDRCKRNCQDCGIPGMEGVKKEGLSTGTQCKIQYPKYTDGHGYTIKLMRTEKRKTINTADYGGMPKAHEAIGETDREVTGSVWKMIAINYDNKQEFEVGEILLEGATALDRLKSFDEMLGCRKCEDVYHKDTRYGPKITYEDGTEETPKSVSGLTKKGKCKEYSISGSKEDSSIIFESGPGTEKRWRKLGKKVTIW